MSTQMSEREVKRIKEKGWRCKCGERHTGTVMPDYLDRHVPVDVGEYRIHWMGQHGF